MFYLRGQIKYKEGKKVTTYLEKGLCLQRESPPKPRVPQVVEKYIREFLSSSKIENIKYRIVQGSFPLLCIYKENWCKF